MTDNHEMLIVQHDYESRYLNTRRDYYINHPQKSTAVQRKSKFQVNPKWKKCFGGRGDDTT